MSWFCKIGVCIAVSLLVAGISSGVASAEEQWEFRIGVTHVSNFHTDGAFNCNGVAGQVQYNFAPHLFIQGTFVYPVSGMTWGTGPVGIVFLGVQF